MGLEKVRSLIFGKVRIGAATMVDGQEAPLLLNAAGEARVALASVPTHAVTASGTFQTAPAAPTTTNVIGAASVNAALVITAAQTLTELTVFNPTAATVYVKLYNKATAPVPATGTGSDAPVTTIEVPAGKDRQVQFGTQGKRFSLGLGYAITAGAAANDNVAVAAGVQLSLTRV